MNARRTSPLPAPTGDSADPSGDPAPTPAAADSLEEPFAPERTRYVGTWPSPLSCSNGMPPLPPDTNLIGSSAADVTRLLPLQVVARLDAAGQLGSIDVSRSGWEQPMTAEQLAAIGIELAEAAEFDDLYLQLTARYTKRDTAWRGAAALRVHGRNPDPECLAAAAASRAAASELRPYAGPGCGRAEVVASDNGYIPTGTPLLHHTWSADD